MMSPLQQILIDMVKEELTADGVTQTDLAAHVGISTKHLSQMLTGKVCGGLETWSNLLIALGVIKP